MKKYITTPIYYVNDVPHIGHAYTTIIADTAARYYRLKGYDVFFLTGTDEHGQKIEESAKKRGKTPKEYADEISSKFKELWDSFEISYDKFIRTTDPEHIRGVQKAFEKMYEKGDIYKDFYEGHYCISCEAFFPQSQLIEGEYCPDCGKETSIVKEESYFFKLSKYQDKLLKWYEENEEAILPKSKKNEVIRFVSEGLSDLSITRTSFDWGVKLPSSVGDPKHVMYVWLDALLNYVTALGYGNDESLMKYWPADYHLVGKDILRFHAVYWPAFLMSLDLPLPRHVAAHGWWTRNGEKMSKSKGNVVDPKEVAKAYGLDNFRYFLLREVPFGQDGDFSQRALIDRINSDLSNDLGNLLNRVIGMSGKYFDYKISGENLLKFHKEEISQTESLIAQLDPLASQMKWHRYLEEIWKILSIANKAIDVHAPWNKMKESKDEEAMATVALTANILAKSALLLYPIMPKSAEKIASALGFEINEESFEKYIEKSEILPDILIQKIPPLFPKIEAPLMQEKKESEKRRQETQETVSIDDFSKISIKTGTIVEATDIPKSKKLLKLKVDLGEDSPRQIVAGIKEDYSPSDLIGVQVCVVANLKPAKIMGILSEGMILAARDEKGLCLISPLRTVQNGTPVK